MLFEHVLGNSFTCRYLSCDGLMLKGGCESLFAHVHFGRSFVRLECRSAFLQEKRS
jgi:hypothetical protein